MNYSIYTADRTTHLKIVVVALAASIGIAGFGIAAHFKISDQSTEMAHVVKAGKLDLRFAASDLTFVNGSPARSATQIK